MVTQLIIVWALAVVAFFTLWAILLKVIKRISEKKKKTLKSEEFEKDKHLNL
jgi:flagellar biosynthesis/type III secretory pathway M-ring protein FliF/YscJ